MILPKIVSSLQSASVLNRDVHDNVLIVHEIYTLSKSSSKKRYISTKLNTEKAYDRLEWALKIIFLAKVFWIMS